MSLSLSKTLADTEREKFRCYFYHMLLLSNEAWCVCRQAAGVGCQILSLVGVAGAKRDPINPGHGAQYLHRPSREEYDLFAMQDLHGARRAESAGQVAAGFRQ
jgi:hypothetical protein